MIIPLEAELPPIRRDRFGDYRVGDTRVLPDLVIHRFQEGSTPDEIVDAYPTLDLAVVYGVVAHYLRHRSEVDAYLDWRDREAARLRAEIEAEQGDQSVIRDRLVARHNLLGALNVAVAE